MRFSRNLSLLPSLKQGNVQVFNAARVHRECTLRPTKDFFAGASLLQEMRGSVKVGSPYRSECVTKITHQASNRKPGFKRRGFIETRRRGNSQTFSRRLLLLLHLVDFFHSFFFATANLQFYEVVLEQRIILYASAQSHKRCKKLPFLGTLWCSLQMCNKCTVTLSRYLFAKKYCLAMASRIFLAQIRTQFLFADFFFVVN